MTSHIKSLSMEEEYDFEDQKINDRKTEIIQDNYGEPIRLDTYLKKNANVTQTKQFFCDNPDIQNQSVNQRLSKKNHLRNLSQMTKTEIYDAQTEFIRNVMSSNEYKSKSVVQPQYNNDKVGLKYLLQKSNKTNSNFKQLIGSLDQTKQSFTHDEIMIMSTKRGLDYLIKYNSVIDQESSSFKLMKQQEEEKLMQLTIRHKFHNKNRLTSKSNPFYETIIDQNDKQNQFEVQSIKTELIERFKPKDYDKLKQIQLMNQKMEKDKQNQIIQNQKFHLTKRSRQPFKQCNNVRTKNYYPSVSNQEKFVDINKQTKFEENHTQIEYDPKTDRFMVMTPNKQFQRLRARMTKIAMMEVESDQPQENSVDNRENESSLLEIKMPVNNQIQNQDVNIFKEFQAREYQKTNQNGYFIQNKNHLFKKLEQFTKESRLKYYNDN